MKKLKKSLAFITTISMLTTFSACNSNNKDSSKEETTTEATTEAVTEEETTEAPTEEITETETTEAEQKLFEEDKTIINLLKTGFTFDGMGTPTINFLPQTNTYVVVAPTSSDDIGYELEATNGNETWDKYVEKFTQLSNTVIDTISTFKEDEDINIRITHTLKTPMPLISYENGEVVFERYKANTSEQVIFTIKTQLDLNYIEFFNDSDVSYDSSKNTCTVKFYLDSDNVEIFKSESITAPFTELNTILKNTIKSYNNPNLAFNVVEVGTETPIYTVENGETTYSIFD